MIHAVPLAQVAQTPLGSLPIVLLLSPKRFEIRSHVLKFMRGFQNPISLNDRPEILPHLIPLGCASW